MSKNVCVFSKIENDCQEICEFKNTSKDIKEKTPPKRNKARPIEK